MRKEQITAANNTINTICSNAEPLKLHLFFDMITVKERCL